MNVYMQIITVGINAIKCSDFDFDFGFCKH